MNEFDAVVALGAGAVLGAALRLPAGYVRRHWRELALILGLGLPLMCLSGSLLAWLLLSVPLLTALLLGAVLAPTDPVLADSIVGSATESPASPGAGRARRWRRDRRRCTG